MQFPALKGTQITRETVDTFLGLNRGTRIAPGEFSEMENLTSDGFPALAVRPRRGVYARPKACSALIAKDSLCYVDGSKFVINGYAVEMGLSGDAGEKPRQLVSMGAYVVIFPDKKYINTADLSDWGMLEARYTAPGDAEFSPADGDGNTRLPDWVQPEAPEEPGNNALWMDTSASPPVLRQWSGSGAMWTAAAESYVKITSPGIGAAFRQYDGVELTGLPESLQQLEGSTVIWARDQDWILIPGLIPERTQSGDGLQITRTVPTMDYVTECGNRLWGCRYGLNARGEFVNEIYACKLGDFRNWSCFMGLTTDSYAVSLGADGPFTGAVTHMGYPLFFRENCLHKIYGSIPANFRLQTTPCRGVQKGSAKSLAILGQILYYKSPHGVCAYDGAMPVEISQVLGEEYCCGAVGGAHGNKYYLSMQNAGGEYRLYVYDSLRKLWHMEDGLRVQEFCSCREELYLLDGEGVIRTVFGTGEPEGPVHWMAQSGELGAHDPDRHYLTGLNLGLRLSPGAQMQILVRYDGEPFWEQAARLEGRDGTIRVPLPLRLRRCAGLQLRLEGTGEARLLFLTRMTERGSDVF